LTPYRPVDQSYLLFFRNVHLFCSSPWRRRRDWPQPQSCR
jgi:hypothetical protein